jgi:histone H3/H4
VLNTNFSRVTDNTFKKNDLNSSPKKMDELPSQLLAALPVSAKDQIECAAAIVRHALMRQVRFFCVLRYMGSERQTVQADAACAFCCACFKLATTSVREQANLCCNHTHTQTIIHQLIRAPT